MLRLVSLLVALIALSSCSSREHDVDQDASSSDSTPAGNNIYMVKINYSKVSYIASGIPHVEVRDESGTVYVDYGSANKSAKAQFDSFYSKAFGSYGVITYSVVGSEELSIGEACFDCTSLRD